MVPKSEGQAEIYWIDCPSGYWDWSGLRWRHGRIKDFATLDEVAKDLCSLKERLRFVQYYLGVPPGDRAIIKAYNEGPASNILPGKFQFVIAGRDPGLPNWLDNGGREQGYTSLQVAFCRRQSR